MGWPFNKVTTDEATGETTEAFWKNIAIGYANNVWQYESNATADGEDGWRKYAFDVVLCDTDTGNEVGTAMTEVCWKIVDGKYIRVRVELISPFYFYDNETGEYVDAYPQADAGFPSLAYASTEPDSPFCDPQYAEYEYMGWKPAADSPLATEDAVEDVASAAAADLVAAHNALPSAHPNISLNAARITSGTLNAARIPGLDASKITSGKFADDRLSGNIARNNDLPYVNDSREGVYIYLDQRGVATSNMRYCNRETNYDNSTIFLSNLSNENVPTNRFETWAFYSRRMHNAYSYTIALSTYFGSDGKGTAETYGLKVLVRLDSSCDGIVTYDESQRKFSVKMPSGDVFRSDGVYAHRWVAFHIVGCTCSTKSSPGVSWAPGNCGTFVLITVYAAAQI